MLRMGFWEQEGFPQCPSSPSLSIVPVSVIQREIFYCTWRSTSSRWCLLLGVKFTVRTKGILCFHGLSSVSGRSSGPVPWGQGSPAFLLLLPSAAKLREWSWVPCLSHSGSRHRLGTSVGSWAQWVSCSSTVRKVFASALISKTVDLCLGSRSVYCLSPRVWWVWLVLLPWSKGFFFLPLLCCLFFNGLGCFFPIREEFCIHFVP